MKILIVSFTQPDFVILLIHGHRYLDKLFIIIIRIGYPHGGQLAFLIVLHAPKGDSVPGILILSRSNPQGNSTAILQELAEVDICYAFAVLLHIHQEAGEIFLGEPVPVEVIADRVMQSHRQQLLVAPFFSRCVITLPGSLILMAIRAVDTGDPPVDCRKGFTAFVPERFVIIGINECLPDVAELFRRVG